MSARGPERLQPRRRRLRRRVLRWLPRLLVVAAVFAVGVAVGQALHDNPKPGVTVTTVRILHP